MGGYIGAKTGTLVASASDIRGDISATDTTPEITLKNTTETDADGTRSGKITFKGEQSGGEESVLAQIQGSHDGTADDQKGDLIFKTNDGSDNNAPTEAMRINSDQNISIPDNGKVMFGTGDDLQIYHDATNSIISNATGDLSFDLAGDFIIDVDGGDVKFKDDGTEFSQYYKDGNDLAIYSSISDGDIKFQGKDGGSVITPVTIDMSEGGYVGIGLTAPTAPLTVKSPANAEAMHIVGRSDDIGQIKFYEADHTTILATLEARNSFVGFGSVANIPLQFMTNNSERSRIDNNGVFMVGKTASDGGVTGFEARPNGEMYVTKSSGNTYFLHDTSSNKFYVNANGGIYNYQSNNVNLSDEREKKNIETLDDKWDAVKAWSLKKFHYNSEEDSDPKKIGVIAQDLETNHPELIAEYEKTEDETRKSVKEQQMMWMAIKALQEAMAKIETLESQNTTQATQIADLITRVTALEAE